MPTRSFRNVQEALIWLTDCHIATYAYQASLKKTARYELKRLREMCIESESICRQFDVPSEKIAELHRRYVSALTFEEEIHPCSKNSD